MLVFFTASHHNFTAILDVPRHKCKRH